MKVSFWNLPIFYIPFLLPLYIVGIMFLFYTNSHQLAWLFVALLIAEFSPVVVSLSMYCFLGTLLPCLWMIVTGYHHLTVLIAMGNGLNFLAVAANNNKMPVFFWMSRPHSLSGPFHQIGTKSTRFKILCDFIRIPIMGLTASVGDFLMWYVQIKIFI